MLITLSLLSLVCWDNLIQSKGAVKVQIMATENIQEKNRTKNGVCERLYISWLIPKHSFLKLIKSALMLLETN